jgi:hypothetical protein
MSKNSILILVFLLAGYSSHAQFTPAKKMAQPVTDSVAAAMCTCIMNNKDSLTTLNNLYVALDGCLKTCSASSIDAILKEDGFLQTDNRKERAAAIRAIGIKLGQKVSRECPGFKEIVNSLTIKENKPELHQP